METAWTLSSLFFTGNSSTSITGDFEIIDTCKKIMKGCSGPAICEFDTGALETITVKECKKLGIIPINAFDSGVVRKVVNSVSGLGHLEGKSITGLADGSVISGTVASGIIALNQGASRIHIGLPYTTDIETLNIETPEGGTIQGKRTKFSEVMVRFYKSRFPFIGQDENSLVEMKQREDEKYGEATKLLSGDKHTYLFPQWTTDGRVFIRQTAPVPLTILAIVPNVEIED